MANAFQNPTMYTNECLAILQNGIVLGANVPRDHEDMFGKSSMKIGDTVNVRRPARMTIRSGATFSAQDYTDTSVALVVNTQKGVDTSFTSKELTLNVQDFSDRVLKPGLIQLAQQLDQDGYTSAKNTVGSITNTSSPGTSPATVAALFDIGRKLDDFSAPRDGNRFSAFDQGTTASLVAGLTGFFNPQGQIGEQFKQGVFVDATNTVGTKIAMSQNVVRHTTGPLGGTPLVNGASQGITAGWANTGTLITDGWTAAAAARTKAGDIFTIANVNAVNPVTRASTGALMQFCCTANQSSDGSGNLTLTMSPQIITAGPFQNVDSVPADNAALTFVGTASTAYARNISWHKDAFALAVVPMIDLGAFGGWGAVRTQNGFSLRVFRQATIAADTVGNRVDALYGWATVYQEMATQTSSA